MNVKLVAQTFQNLLQAADGAKTSLNEGTRHKFLDSPFDDDPRRL